MKLPYSHLLREGRIRKYHTNAQEIASRFEVVKRDLADASLPELSPDRRFATAYNAVLQTAKAIMNTLFSRKRLDLALLLVILPVALFLRVYGLDDIPPGLHYDEAANAILAADIAKGKTHPLFIEAYTGKGVFFFYLAAAFMRLLGASVFSLRLTSALIGTLTVLMTYQLAREMFAHQGARASRWLALFSAALLATSCWHVTLSRYGFRAISQPLLQALTLWCLWRGLRRGALSLSKGGSGSWLALGGLFSGATAYTYLASRVFPVILLLVFLGLLVFERGNLKRRLSQIAVFAFPAAIVFAPLGFYFLTHPQAFSIRISQVSLFNPELNRGDVLGTFWRAARLAFGMIGLRGEPLWRFNLPGKPVFSWPLSVFLLLGLAFSLIKLVGRRTALERTFHFLMLVWLPVMLLPSILAVKEVPSALRSVGLIPLLFLLPAQGLWMVTRWLAEVIPSVVSRLFGMSWGYGVGLPNSLGMQRDKPQQVGDSGLSFMPTPKDQASKAVLPVVALILLLSLTGIATFRDYFVLWAKAAPVYYDNDGDLVDVAKYLNQLDTADEEIFVSSIHYRHPTLAFLARSYDKIKWLVGRETVVFPKGTDKSALYVFPHSARLDDTLLEEFFSPSALVEETLGPDSEPAFTAYLFVPEQLPEISPQNPMSINLGNTLEFLGYDVLYVSRFTFYFYWRVLQPPDRDDYSIFVHLVDQWGFRWGEEGFFDYPSAQWSPGDVIVNSKEIGVQPGAPPGEYQVMLGVYSASLDSRLPRLDEQGQIVGTTISLGPVMLSKPQEPPVVESLAIQNPRKEDFGGKVAFLGYDRDSATVRPGESIYLAFYWQAQQDLDEDYSVVIGLRGGRGNVWPLWSDRPVHGTYPTLNWTAGEFVKDRYGLTIGQDIPAGDYELELMLLNHVTYEPLVASSGLPTISLGHLKVEAWERQFTIPAVQHPLEVNLGNQVELLGYDLDRTSTKPGESLHLTLYWRALADMDASYTVFTHLLDGESRIWGQKDSVPKAGTYPTTLWVEGEVVADEYEIAVKPDAPPGEYVIEVGIYVPQSGQRLPVLDELGQVQGDRILLEAVEIE
jgi:4-amino-4-deoxy-L-arabinose transferase-like glycosyltransferase